MSSAAAIWHEVECGRYEADLPLWEELARRHPDPVLDVGAGTGRVSLRLAAAGANVVALEREPALLAELERRVDGIGPGTVTTAAGDARHYLSGERFGLIIVAMQTIQLFGGRSGRLDFLRCARRHLAPAGCVAIAVADLAQGACEIPFVFEPDVLQVGSERYSSRPVFVRLEQDEVVIERERIHAAAGGEVERSVSCEAIDRVSPEAILEEATLAGFGPGRREAVPATGSYAGAVVVVLDG